MEHVVVNPVLKWTGSSAGYWYPIKNKGKRRFGKRYAVLWRFSKWGIRSAVISEIGMFGNVTLTKPYNPFALRLENELQTAFAKVPEIAYEMYVEDKRRKEALNNG